MTGPNTPPQDPGQHPQYGTPQYGAPQQPHAQQQPQQPYPSQPYPPQQPQQPQYGAPSQPMPGQPGQPGAFAQFGQHYPTSPTQQGELSQQETMFLWGIVGASAVVLICAFLPWVSYTGGTASGTGDGGDGWFTLILALIAGGLAVATVILSKQQPILPKVASIGSIVAGVIVTLIAVVDMADIKSSANDLGPFAEALNIDFSIGFGLWITLLGGLALIGLGVMGLLAPKMFPRK